MKKKPSDKKRKLDAKLVKKLDVIHAPFPAKHFDVRPAAPAPVPPVIEPPSFQVKCKVESISTHWFGDGTIFVALEATDGQNLLNLLRKDQEVTLKYKPTI